MHLYISCDWNDGPYLLHLSVLVKIPKRLSVIRLLGLADVRGENLNTLCRQENSWLASSQSTHLGPCREEEKSWSLWEKSLNGGEELLHLCVEGGNVLKSGKEVQRQMRRMTIEE